jgi:hypothetical protein
MKSNYVSAVLSVASIAASASAKVAPSPIRVVRQSRPHLGYAEMLIVNRTISGVGISVEESERGRSHVAS